MSLEFPNPAQASDEQLAYAAESWLRLVELTKDEPVGSEGSFLACCVWAVWVALGEEMRRRNEVAIEGEIAHLDDAVTRILDDEDG